MIFSAIDGEILSKFAQARIGIPLLDKARSLLDDRRYCGEPMECSL
jgi:hypothetical protein